MRSEKLKNKKKIILSLSIVVCILIAFSFWILGEARKCEARELFPLTCPFKEESELLADLRKKRFAGEKISKEKYRQSANQLILEVDPEVLGWRYNGLACKNFGYVRNDLPEEAKKFVKRHELEHLLQTSKERNKEFSANYAAAKEYPLGFLQTILFSLQTRAKFYDSPVCYILTLLETFRVYFLPFKK